MRARVSWVSKPLNHLPSVTLKSYGFFAHIKNVIARLSWVTVPYLDHYGKDEQIQSYDYRFVPSLFGSRTPWKLSYVSSTTRLWLATRPAYKSGITTDDAHQLITISTPYGLLAHIRQVVAVMTRFLELQAPYVNSCDEKFDTDIWPWRYVCPSRFGRTTSALTYYVGPTSRPWITLLICIRRCPCSI